MTKRVIVLSIVFVALAISYAYSKDNGQWNNTDPDTHNWYQRLMRPDAPSASCCTEADAYWADEFFYKDGKMYAKITDDRDDAPLGRPHIANGTIFEVPPEKLKYDDGNPTGHGVLFVSISGYAWCYVQGMQG